MMKPLIIALSLLLTSCATGRIKMSPNHKGIDAEFTPYVEEFIHASKGMVDRSDFKNLTMGFTDFKKGSSVAGTCWKFGRIAEIEISRKWWDNNYSQLKRQELIFHEFGHCILNRPHTDISDQSGLFHWLERMAFRIGFLKKKGYLADSCPASYMHPYILSDYCIGKHYFYYLDELFYKTSYKKWLEKTRKCPETRVVNETLNWTDDDKWSLKRAKYVCINDYKSCLKVFIKKEERRYQAICR